MGEHTIEDIKKELEPFHLRLDQHPINESIDLLEKLKVFMAHHIFSVWDFMNILKTLQLEFTCMSIPWRPVDYPELARFIHEIVLEEESDDISGSITSHFSYYVHALSVIDPDNSIASSFLQDLESEKSYEDLIQASYIPKAAQEYLKANYQLIYQKPILEVAAVFAFGRELLIPRLFRHLLDQFKAFEHPEIKDFVLYLERHIDLDEDHHGPLAEKMVLSLMGSKKDIETVKRVAKNALEARVLFWDGILNALKIN